MKYTEKCDHCGHENTAYTHSLNVGKVEALKQLVDLYEKTKEPIHLGQLGISNSQYTNFCHLVYFGLAEHVKEGWVPTEIGIKFIYGETGVTVPQAVLSGRVLPEDHKAWQTHPGEREIKFVFDIDNTAYKKRPEYAAERTQTLFD